MLLKTYYARNYAGIIYPGLMMDERKEWEKKDGEGI
jgi:hypothetical protein